MSPRSTGRLTPADKKQIVADLTRLNEEATEVLERWGRERVPAQDNHVATVKAMIKSRERIISKLSIGLPKEVPTP